MSERAGTVPGKPKGKAKAPPVKPTKKPRVEGEEGAEPAEEGYETEHQDYCEVCQAGGEIMLCDTCPRAYHLVCLDPDMEEAPEGTWSCPHCEAEGVPDQTETEPETKAEKAENEELCRACRDGGLLLCCDACPASYHAVCLNPPLAGDPPEEWYCPRCSCEEPPHRPEKILSWRWIEIKIPEQKVAPAPAVAAEGEAGKEGKEGGEEAVEPEKAKGRPARIRREREFFIKWKYRSYWHCEWVNELVLDVWFPQTMRMYWRKGHDMENPPEVDVEEEVDISKKHEAQMIREEEEAMAKEAEEGEGAVKVHKEDGHNLYHRFYKYGIKPLWLQVHRILNHK